ncbi:MAG: N,N-dimethylformamidase beta subunit family domain-containing protein, partial [Dehalococcoidia bacterium]
MEGFDLMISRKRLFPTLTMLALLFGAAVLPFGDRSAAPAGAATLAVQSQGLAAGPGPGQPSVTPHQGPVSVENQKPGTTAWQSAALSQGRGQPASIDTEDSTVQSAGGVAAASVASAPAASTPCSPCWYWQGYGDDVIRGYADQTSVNHGAPITFFVSTVQPSYAIDVFRMGWYGGTGANLILHTITMTGINQPVPAPDLDTGLLDANWQPAYTLQTGADWTSGIYLAKLTADNGSVGYINFVVRADGTAADIVYQEPVATYQAYNNWGGKSLYDFQSTNNVPAVKVSYNRPYTDWSGAGSFFDGDYNMVRWLEEQGYNVTYITSVDLHENPRIMNNRKVFLSNFHDEYYSRPMRENLTAARDRGANIAFLDANDVNWQIRFEPSAAGSADRTEVCYKDASSDPMATTNPSLTTTHWADPPVNQPESSLVGEIIAGALGSANGDYPTGVDWVVNNASHWIYNGTGLRNGDHIAKLVGYEFDKVFPNDPNPPGMQILSNSPVGGTHQNSTIYTAAGGAIVFSAGSSYWSWELDDNDFLSYGADSRVQRMTSNLLNTMIGNAPTPTPSPTAAPSPSPVPTATPAPSATPRPSVTPSPSPAPGGNVLIYGDSLASGWSDASWGATVNYANGTPVYAGNHSISFNVTGAWGALAVKSASATTIPAGGSVSFAARASQAGQNYVIWLADQNGNQVGNQLELAGYGGSPVAGTWKLYHIPFTDLGAAGQRISGVVVQ